VTDTDIWEGEGGADAAFTSARFSTAEMVRRVEWAERILRSVSSDFDRVASALTNAAGKNFPVDKDIQLLVAICLETKRAEVTANGRADYFIHVWQELNGRVRLTMA